MIHVRGYLERLGGEALVFAMLRTLTLLGGMAALLVVPAAPEHRLHIAPLFAGFLVYKTALLGLLARWPARAREIFLATLGADLALVFLLVWFTGGATSHFYLLFYLLVALNAYEFGPAVGTLAAGFAALLLALAAVLASPDVPWAHVASRAALLGLLGLSLGHVAARERAARARVEQLNREMERAMGRLARAEHLAAIGRLSAKMAHEVRNPLGAINLNVELLADVVRQTPGPAMAEADDMLRAVREEIRALTEITDEYLVAARLPRPRFEKEPLGEIVADLVAFLRPLADRRHVAIALRLDGALPPVACDRAMVRQAVRNLVKNALEAVAEGGRVEVRTQAAGGFAEIAVADDGAGIGPEVATCLSEPFFTTKPRGTGLGLSITREIARRHGGDLAWTNRSSGGAEFVLRLSLEEVRDE